MRTVERLLVTAQLPSRRLGRRRLIPRAAVIALSRRDILAIAAPAEVEPDAAPLDAMCQAEAQK